MTTSFSPRAAREDIRVVSDIFAKRLAERGVGISDSGFPVLFSVDSALEEDEFMIKEDGGGVVITSGTVIGLIGGTGHFLRGMIFKDSGAEITRKTTSVKPVCPIRGAYLAWHFHNFYHSAPVDEVARYMEDLALLGFNYLMVSYPMIDLESEDDPECADNLARMNLIFAQAHRLGMKTATGAGVNGAYKKFPKEYLFKPHKDPLGRRGNSGNMMCPSIPEAADLSLRYNLDFLKALKHGGLDMLVSWPYDEGGCGCEKCWPWGGNGFIKHTKRLFTEVQKIYPNIERCVSTWCFDTPYEGEWKAFFASIVDEKWCDVIMADAHEDFPRYPLENPIPRSLPLINFPEISMWGLFPWGGYGATALPKRFERLWNQARDKLSGGFLYSEGIFEDINKAVIAQFYMDSVPDTVKTLTEYARFELGISDPAPFLELIELLEKTHTDVEANGICDTTLSDRAFSLAESIDKTLPLWAKNAWRWRIIYLRVKLDMIRYRRAEASGNEKWRASGWKGLLENDEEALAAFREIIEIFHCMEDAGDDPYHCRVRPVCG